MRATFMLKKLLKITGVESQEEREAKLYRDLIRHEAKIGGELFGPVPEGGQRQFFCLDKYTWIWYEQWKDQSGNFQSRTTRYAVRPSGIVKSVDGGKSYTRLSKNEISRLFDAVKAYERRVWNEIYKPVLQ
jgi:hypothetical protein